MNLHRLTISLLVPFQASNSDGNGTDLQAMKHYAGGSQWEQQEKHTQKEPQIQCKDSIKHLKNQSWRTRFFRQCKKRERGWSDQKLALVVFTCNIVEGKTSGEWRRGRDPKPHKSRPLLSRIRNGDVRWRGEGEAEKTKRREGGEERGGGCTIADAFCVDERTRARERANETRAAVWEAECERDGRQELWVELPLYLLAALAPPCGFTNRPLQGGVKILKWPEKAFYCPCQYSRRWTSTYTLYHSKK